MSEIFFKDLRLYYKSKQPNYEKSEIIFKGVI